VVAGFARTVFGTLCGALGVALQELTHADGEQPHRSERGITPFGAGEKSRQVSGSIGWAV